MSRWPAPIERFMGSIQFTENGCWEWTRQRNMHGYGEFRFNGKMWKAHRWSYTELVGPIAEGLVIDHLCRNRACVNPEHLEPVTHAENMSRGLSATKTHCANGHEYTPENTRLRKGTTQRMCRACSEIAVAKYRAKRRGTNV